MNSSLYNNYRYRIRAFILVVIILNLIFLSNFFSIQILDHGFYNEIIAQEIVRITKERGARGKILDRNGIILAENIKKFDFWVNTAEDFERESIASIFSETFNKSYEYYLNLLAEHNHHLVIEKNIEEIDCEKILLSINDIKGLYCNASNKRFYPYDNLVSTVVGFLGSKDEYSSGVEHYFNELLLGEESELKHMRLDNGKIERSTTIIPSGKNIGLSIDLEIQTILAKELKNGIQKSGAKSGNGIVVDPYSGEILAMASYPDYNPNQYSDFNPEYYKNRTISKNYEPGSTYKIVALAAALEKNLLSVGDSIYCENGSFTLKNGHTLHDHEPYEYLTIPQVFAFSSNIGMAKIADLLDNKVLYDKSREFGFGVSTGILLPDEQSGFIRPINEWSYQSNKSLAIGQEMSCTTLQLAMAYSVIANGGYLLQPTIINYVGNNEMLKENPNVIRRVMSLELSRELLSMLTDVVDYGSGSNASIRGYGVSGKTGTAEKFIDGKYSKSDYISSFASIFPSKKPKYVCIISIDSPDKSRGKHWGNETAAPITKEIYKKIINIKNIKPETFTYIDDNNIIGDSNVMDFFDLQCILKIRQKNYLNINPKNQFRQTVLDFTKANYSIDNNEYYKIKI